MASNSSRNADTELDLVRVLLRTELFSTGGPDAHVPPGVAIVDGRVRSHTGAGLVVEVQGVFDAGGRRLDAPPCTLLLPTAKIDHVLVLDT